MTITHTSKFATPNPYAALLGEVPQARSRVAQAMRKELPATSSDRLPAPAARSSNNLPTKNNADSKNGTTTRGVAAAALAAGGIMALRAPQRAAAMELPTNWRIFSSFSANGTRYDLNYYDDNYDAAKDADSDIRACCPIVEPAFAAATTVYFGTKNKANAMLWGSQLNADDPCQRCITGGFTQGSANGAAALSPSHTGLLVGFALLYLFGYKT